MTYTVITERSASRTIKHLLKVDRARIFERIQTLAKNPRPHDAEKMAGSDFSYRLRVGKYRIPYKIHDKILQVLVVKVGNRGEIYKKRMRSSIFASISQEENFENSLTKKRDCFIMLLS